MTTEILGLFDQMLGDMSVACREVLKIASFLVRKLKGESLCIAERGYWVEYSILGRFLWFFRREIAKITLQQSLRPDARQQCYILVALKESDYRSLKDKGDLYHLLLDALEAIRREIKERALTTKISIRIIDFSLGYYEAMYTEDGFWEEIAG